MRKNIIKTTAIIGAVAIIGAGAAGMYDMYKTNQKLMAENIELKAYSIEMDGRLTDVTHKYEETSDKYLEVYRKYVNLEEQVYNVMNKKDYEIHIDHNGVTCNYKKTFDNSKKDI